MAGKQFDLSVIFRVLDKATNPLKRINKTLSNVSADKAIKSLNKLKKAGERISQIGRDMALKVTAPLLALGGGALNSSIKFESAFAGVRKTVNATDKELAKVKKGLLGLALEIPIDTTEFFKIGEAAGQLGIKTDNIVKFSKVMATLAATTNLSAEEAAFALAKFAEITDFPQDQVDRLGSTIVGLGNNMVATERDIVDMALELASAGKRAGLSEAEIFSFSAALTSVGLEAQRGGTAFSKVFQRIGKEIGSGNDKIKLFAKISGKTVKEFEEDFKNNATKAVLDFTEGINKLDKLDKLEKQDINIDKVLEFLGFKDFRVADALSRAAGAGDSFRKAIVLGTKSFDENKAADEELAKRLKTTRAQLILTKNRAEQAAVTFGDILKGALDKVNKAIRPIIDMIKNLDKEKKTLILIISSVLAAISPFLIALGGMAKFFGVTMIGALKIFGSALLIPLAKLLLLAGLAFVIAKNWEPIKILFQDIGNVLSEAFKGNLEPLNNFLTDFNNFIAEKIAEFVMLVERQMRPLEKILSDIKKTIKKTMEDVFEFGPEIFDNFKKSVKDLLNFIPGLNDTKTELGETNTGLDDTKTGTRKSLLAPKNETSIFDLFKFLPEIINNQTKTDINVKVSTEQGTAAEVEKVNKVGSANINIATVGFTGMS